MKLKNYVKYERRPPTNIKDPFGDLITKDKHLSTFGSSMLGLGEINVPSFGIEALVCFFDLQGFTKFSNQDSPELVLPTFLSKFLNWMFEEYKNENIIKSKEKHHFIYAPFPFYAKFLGDGIMLIWKIDKKSIVNYAGNKWEKELNGDIGNIISILLDLTTSYRQKLYPKLNKRFTNVPSVLRCGVSRGTIYSVGNGDDFIGPCINKAARLQKLHDLSFAVSAKGINDNKWFNSGLRNLLTAKIIELRGIGEEIVFVRKDELERSSNDIKMKFRDVN